MLLRVLVMMLGARMVLALLLAATVPVLSLVSMRTAVATAAAATTARS